MSIMVRGRFFEGFSKKYFDFSKMDKKNVQNQKPNLLFGKNS